MKTVGSGQSAVGRKACSPEGVACAHSCPLPTAHCPLGRQAFTLVELLIAISIVAILATLLLGAAATAGETARDARTKSLVARLHTLLIEKYDSYRSARVELRPYTDNDPYRNGLRAATGMAVPSVSAAWKENDPRIEALTRLAATRELMKLEMPDRWTDLTGAVLQASPTEIPTVNTGRYLGRTPTLYASYVRAFNRIVPVRTGGKPVYINTVTKLPNTADDIQTNEGAELLYLIIMNATADGEARALFKQGDIGDTDGDGAQELLDGWGQPISFVRWAPGFQSDAQLSFPGLNRLYDRFNGNATEKREQVDRALREDHDPFDLFSLDQPDLTAYTGTSNSVGPRGWRLMPLVVSPGGDGELGLELRTGTAMRLDPYARFAGPAWIGQVIDPINDDLAADNVHSHRVGALSRKR